jgi:hypothetical protein
MLHKVHDWKDSEGKKIMFGREPQGVCSQDQHIGGKQPVVK